MTTKIFHYSDDDNPASSPNKSCKALESDLLKLIMNIIVKLYVYHLDLVRASHDLLLHHHHHRRRHRQRVPTGWSLLVATMILL